MFLLLIDLSIFQDQCLKFKVQFHETDCGTETILRNMPVVLCCQYLYYDTCKMYTKIG